MRWFGLLTMLFASLVSAEEMSFKYAIVCVVEKKPNCHYEWKLTPGGKQANDTNVLMVTIPDTGSVHVTCVRVNWKAKTLDLIERHFGQPDGPPTPTPDEPDAPDEPDTPPIPDAGGIRAGGRSASASRRGSRSRRPAVRAIAASRSC